MRRVPRVVLAATWLGLRLASGARHRLSRRLTTAGLGALGALVASAILGMDTKRTVAYQVFTFLVAALAVAIVASARFRPAVRVRRVLPAYASTGTPFTYRIHVTNGGQARLAGLRVLEDLADPRPALGRFIAAARQRRGGESAWSCWRGLVARARITVVREVEVPAVAPGRDVDVLVESVPARRGRIVWTGVTVARPDPLGLVKAFARVRAPDSLLVVPHRYPVPGVALTGTRRYQPGGVALAASVGESEEFLGLRDYRPGDPLRRIHWKSWARTGRPIVREYQEEFFVPQGLVLDTFVASPGEAFEEAVSVAASFACAVETHETLLDLMFVGTGAYCFTAGRGLASTARMLEILAAVEASGERSFDELRHLVLERSGLLSGAICVLLAWDEARRRFIDELGALGIPALVLVVTERGASIAGASRHPDARLIHLEAGRVAEGLGAL